MKIKHLILPAIAIAFMAASCNAQDKKSSGGSMKNQNDSVSYGLGVSIGNNLKNGGLDSINVDLLAQGMKDFFKGKPTMTPEQSEAAIQQFMQAKEKSKGDDNLKKGQAFLEENKKKTGVQVTASGLQYIVEKQGTGAKPTINDKITAHYHGTLIDGTVFDSSVERGQPASFPVSGVIPGWTEILQMMPVGSKYKVFLPANLAYGEHAPGGKIGPNSVLIFEIELISIDTK